MSATGPHRPPAATTTAPEADDHRSTALIVLVVTLVLAGAVFVGRQLLVEQDPPLEVRVFGATEEVVVEVPEGSTVSTALAAAGVVPVDGRLLSAASGSVLDAAHDPAVVILGGSPVDPGAPLRRGQNLIVRVVDGADQVEGTVEEEAAVPIPTGGDDSRFVMEAGRPGLERRVLGEISGEVVSVETLVEAVAPHRTERKVVALTFDDGPTERWTPFILAILADRDVVATFCIVGDTLRKNPDVARQIVEAGHALCNHTLGHDLNMVGASQAVLDEQIHGMNGLMADMGLPPADVYRPPGGYLSDEIRATAAAAGQRLLMWKVDTRDWSTSSTIESVMEAVHSQVEPGAVILMHDGGGRDRILSVSVLGRVIDELRAEGYEFTLPHLPAG